MMLDDREIGELFERSIREMHPGFETQLLRVTHDAEIEAAPTADAPVEVVFRAVERASTRSRRRSMVVFGVAAAVIATAIAGIALRDEQASDIVPGSLPKSPDGQIGTVPQSEVVGTEISTATTASAATSTAVPVAASRLSWSRADAGSIARSQVTKVIAGTVGFVAIGMGFDSGANQGRVWFSVDGTGWEEPALDIFDTLAVEGVASTADGFFVLAYPNPDRLPSGPGQLYRSVDGRSWEPVGEPVTQPSSLGNAAGGLLLASLPNVRWSANGVTWTDATIDLSGTGLIDVELPNVAAVAYIRGLASGGLQIFESIDGLTWSMLPPPPLNGPFAFSPDGLTVMANPDEQRCAEAADAEKGDPNVTDATWRDRFLETQWNCTSVLQLTTYDRSTQSWSEPTDGPGPSPIYAPLVLSGDLWVAPVIEANRALTVWTATADGTTWTREAGTTLQFEPIDELGSPQAPVAAAGHGIVVVVTPDRAVDGQTVVLRGTTQPGQTQITGGTGVANTTDTNTTTVPATACDNSSAQIVVPPLVGQRTSAAIASLEDLCLAPAIEYHSADTNAVVTHQTPDPGTAVAAGSVVTLTSG